MREYRSIGKGYLDLFVWENDNQNPPPLTNAAQAMVPTLSTPIERRTQSLLASNYHRIIVYLLFIPFNCNLCFQGSETLFLDLKSLEFIEDQAAVHTRGSVIILSTKSFLKTCI